MRFPHLCRNILPVSITRCIDGRAVSLCAIPEEHAYRVESAPCKRHTSGLVVRGGGKVRELRNCRLSVAPGDSIDIAIGATYLEKVLLAQPAWEQPWAYPWEGSAGLPWVNSARSIPNRKPGPARLCYRRTEDCPIRRAAQPGGQRSTTSIPS
jgi:hypothetical protein